MSSEPQPEAVWYFPEKKSNKGRIWLIVGLATAAAVFVGVALFLFLPRGDAAPADQSLPASPTPSPTATTTATPTPRPTSTPTGTASPVPKEEPPAATEPDSAPAPPPAPRPDVSTFAEHVQPWLDDAATGLGFVAHSNGQEAVQIIDSLQQDAQRLSEPTAPSSVSSDWYAALGQYSAKLGALRSAAESGTVPQSALDGAHAALKKLRQVIGL